jgi:hypothetical protein
MNNSLQISYVLQHFLKNGHEMCGDTIQYIFNKLKKKSDQMNANDLCNAIIDNFFELYPLSDNTNFDKYVTYSSIYAVACELTGKLTDPDAIQYTKSRGGLIFHNFHKYIEKLEGSYECVTLRQVVNWMIIQ